MDDHTEEYIDKLILAGAIEVSGIIAATGEFTYSFTEKLKTMDKNLKREIDAAFAEEIQELWALGYIDMDMTLSNPVVVLALRSTIEEERAKLPEQLRVTLEYVMSILRK
tara:strand:- start:16882 stop:17211 length:330 start_codon:yes stop_codon:yes gene_type:complete